LNRYFALMMNTPGRYERVLSQVVDDTEGRVLLRGAFMHAFALLFVGLVSSLLYVNSLVFAAFIMPLV
jgi:hypothetical protein